MVTNLLPTCNMVINLLPAYGDQCITCMYNMVTKLYLHHGNQSITSMYNMVTNLLPT